MQAQFLLGPAGSGKTFRCLAEIRAALKKNPEGKPLIFLAPKQATFQLERQLLVEQASSLLDKNGQAGCLSHNYSLDGYTRLHILSFERLARFIFEKLNVAPPEQLNDEGRVMVLRALLLRHENELKLFRQSARRPGFAQQLSELLRELQQHQFTPAKLRSLAQREHLRRELRDKLNDLALLHENYSRWLTENKLQDANCLLNFATDALRKTFDLQPSTFNLSALWLDGFAEMTPQELDLLAAVLPLCESATLAFCLDESGVNEKENSWLSIWNVAGKSFQQCRQRIENLPGAKIEIEFLKRDSRNNRFAQNPALRKLEIHWQSRTGILPVSDSSVSAGDRLEACPTIIVCANPEAEAVFAAREILKFVRAGNRFRDCAILVRNLENYHKPLARVFRRYEIPFFLDRRESVAHHPLAELTRSALRTIIFEWRPNDLFAALKAGFCSVEETEIDRLENAALEFGWRGKKWRESLPDEFAERLRRKILPPLENFHAQLAKLKFQPDGRQLAGILREFWSHLGVEKTLESWSAPGNEQSQIANPKSQIHSTVWEQMTLWLENLELAFAGEQLPLRDWLPILESGLANLTIGVIPPVLDEVLIGAPDRARNPDLKFVLVLGVNETLFPATPAAQTVLTDADRDELSIPLGPDLHDRLARERYYGYIACTRASEKLAVTFSQSDANGKLLNPSPFVAQLQKIFPALEIEQFQNEIKLADAGHANEIAPVLFPIQDWDKLFELPALAKLRKSLGDLREPNPEENLSPEMAEKLYGATLRTSVSRLEEFASCPFRFFVRSGLRAEERKVFELDARERGSFQHDALKIFHEQLMAEGKRWRDLTPVEARERIRAIAGGLTENYRDGLLRDTAQSRFEARALTESLQDFVGVIVSWLREQNDFDPSAAELEFDNKPGARAPAWEIEMGGGHKMSLHGRIDRVDLWRKENDGDALALVLDYKSSGKKLDKILVAHGVQLQLLAYLNVLRHWKNPSEIFGVNRLVPAGVFYVNLRGEYKSGGSREEILADADEARRRAYRHTGRFDAGVLDKLDRIHAKDQFNYQLKTDGGLYANSVEALPREEFGKLLDGVETQLRGMGERIFSGAAQVDPYRKGKQTPCEFCDYQAACRIDKWTHEYRILRDKDGRK